MSATTNLKLPYIGPKQADKDITYNIAINKLDKLIGGALTVNFTADSDITLSESANDYLVLKFTDTGSYLTTNRSIIVPDINRLHLIWNNTGTGTYLTIKTSAGTGINIGDGEKRLVFCDGVNVESITGFQNNEYPLDVNFFHSGILTNSELLYLIPFCRVSVFPANMLGSYAKSLVAATAGTTLSIRKNGVEFSTVTFPIASTTAEFNTSSQTVFNPGDVLSVYGPTSADATLADIGFNFKISSIST